LIVEHLAVGALACNCTIVADEQTGEAIVVDGGDEVERITSRLDALGVRAIYLVHTHAHFDHIGALGDLRARTGARGLLHPADLPLYATLREQARWFGVRPPEIVTLDGDLREGDILNAGGATLEVLHTPGHTPGSVSFALAGPERATMLLTGDTLFRGAVAGPRSRISSRASGPNYSRTTIRPSSSPDTGLRRRSDANAAKTRF